MIRAGRDHDADELASWCSRLVVRGGPGSGKTWLARRTARLCAQAALAALAGGAGLDEIELPLFTTRPNHRRAAPAISEAAQDTGMPTSAGRAAPCISQVRKGATSKRYPLRATLTNHPPRWRDSSNIWIVALDVRPLVTGRTSRSITETDVRCDGSAALRVPNR